MTWLYSGWLASLFVLFPLCLALGITVTALWAHGRKWIPLALATGAYLIAPSAVALFGHGGLDAALLGTALPPRNPFFLRGAYLAVEVALPLIVLVAAIGAVGWMRSRRRQAYLLAALAVLSAISVQLGAYDAGTVGLPTILAFEHPADRRPACGGDAALDAAAPGASGAAPMGSALGGLLAATPSNDASASAPDSLPCRVVEGDAAVAAKSPVAAAAGGVAAAPAREAAMVDRLTQLRDSHPTQDIGAVTSAHQGSPAEQFAYVRDQIKTDAYAGAMRGAVGTAITGAGNPTDKALLLAELLKSGGATVRFARATLEATDIAKLIDAARAAPSSAGAGIEATSAAIDRAVNSVPEPLRGTLRAALVKSSEAAHALNAKADLQRAQLAKSLAANHVVLGNDAQMRAEAMRALREHVWVQVQDGSDWQDLDASLPTLQPGQHLPTARDITTFEELPDEQYVTLEVRAIATRGSNGPGADIDVINASRRVIDLLAKPLRLEILPDSSVSPKDLGTVSSFHAHLHIASDDIDGDSFPIDDPDKGSLLALGVLITVNRPGLGAITYTRSVLERRDPSGGIAAGWTDRERVSCALVSRFQGLVVSGKIAPDEYQSRSLDELIALESALAAHRRPDSSDGFAGDYPYTALRYFYRTQLLSPAGMRFFVDRPNIGFERLSLDCPSGQVVSRTSIDIMENGQSAIASNAAVGAAANLARGALDEVVETDLKGARGNGIDAPTLMTTAASLKIPVVMLRPGESGALKALSLPPMFEHAIGATLAAGQFALATQGPVMVAGAPHMAWWAVDPASGSAIGRVDDGGGQAMVEEIIQQANTTVSILNVMEFSFSLEGCVWRGATLAVQVEDFDVGACMARVVCVLMVQDATDYGLSMLGLLTEFEPTAETFEFMTNFLELTGGPDAPGPACGEGE